MVLEQNGFAQFNIEKDSGGVWRVVSNPGDEEKQKYALYTGTEDKEKKEILRLI